MDDFDVLGQIHQNQDRSISQRLKVAQNKKIDFSFIP